MELLDIIDDNGNIISKANRKLVHEKGLRHHASGLIIIDKMPGGGYKMLSQQRAFNKDKNPGLFDISASGHVQSGQDVVDSLLREVQEELSLNLNREQLQLFKIYWRNETFNNGTFIENELDYIYISQLNLDISKIKFQKEEIEQIVWLTVDEIKLKIEDNKMVKRPFWTDVLSILTKNSK